MVRRQNTRDHKGMQKSQGKQGDIWQWEMVKGNGKSQWKNE